MNPTQQQIDGIQTELKNLKEELDRYTRSGFWTRRDVIRNMGLGTLGLLGVAGLSKIAKADTQITDTGITIGGKAVAITNNIEFTADNTINRAIPHGLGKAPIAILLGNTTTLFFYVGACDYCYVSNTGLTPQSVTAADTTNFYASSGSANYSNMAVKGIAFG